MRHAPVLFALITVVAACGGAAKPAPTPPSPPAPTCKGAAGHMVDAMAASMDPRPPDDTVNGLIELIRVRCEADRWSPEAVKCLTEMTTGEQADLCGTLLTDDQQAALLRDQEAKFQRDANVPAPDKATEPSAKPDGSRRRSPSLKSQDGAGTAADPCDGGE